jgi:hypothetical protein
LGLLTCQGLFENDVDLDIIRDFTNELDLANKSLTSFLYLDNAEALEYRRELDAGALDRLLDQHLSLVDISAIETQNNKNPMRTWPPDRCHGYRLCLPGAAVMRLGCVVRPDFRQLVVDLHAKVGFSRNAQVQLQHALNICVDGIPYNFRDKPRPVGLDKSGFMDDQIWGDIGEYLIDLGDNPEPAVKMLSRLFLGPLL